MPGNSACSAPRRRRLYHCGRANLCRCRYLVSLTLGIRDSSLMAERMEKVGFGGWPGQYFWFCRLLRGGDSDLSFVSIVASASFSTSTGARSRSSSTHSGCQQKMGDENKNGQRYVIRSANRHIYNTTLKILQLINACASWVA